MINQTQDLEQRARKVLETVELMGVDFVRGSKDYNSDLTYGLNSGLFDQADVDTAQKTYETSRRK